MSPADFIPAAVTFPLMSPAQIGPLNTRHRHRVAAVLMKALFIFPPLDGEGLPGWACPHRGSIRIHNRSLSKNRCRETLASNWAPVSASVADIRTRV